MFSSKDLISREDEKDPMTVHHTMVCACTTLENYTNLVSIVNQ